MEVLDKDRGAIYQTRYTSPYGDVHLLTGICGFGSYTGDIVPELMDNLEDIEHTQHKEVVGQVPNFKPIARGPFRRPLSRRKRFTLVT